MIITVASYKGGVGKTTTAVHIAAYLQSRAPTLLLDADRRTRNALNWSQRGAGLPFKVAPDEHAARLASSYRHTVIDTGQGASEQDLKAAAEGCELLVIPAVPAPLDTDGLGQMILALQTIGATNYRVLLTRVPPDAAKDAAELRGMLAEMKAPVFKAEIPRLKAFEKAAGAGQIVKDADDRNAARAAAAYEAAGKELPA
jgi:chromosome partitioning protein